MHLKSQVEWGLHCCAILASLPEGSSMSTRALSAFHGVPKEYLAKALQNLSQAGLVSGTLGPSGGYRLLKSPAAISFLEVVEAIEGKKTTFQCANIRANNPCRPNGHRDNQSCAVARIMWKADEAWRHSLSTVSLADLLDDLVASTDPSLLSKTRDWIEENAA